MNAHIGFDDLSFEEQTEFLQKAWYNVAFAPDAKMKIEYTKKGGPMYYMSRNSGAWFEEFSYKQLCDMYIQYWYNVD